MMADRDPYTPQTVRRPNPKRRKNLIGWCEEDEQTGLWWYCTNGGYGNV